jgi:MFS family permease
LLKQYFEMPILILANFLSYLGIFLSLPVITLVIKQRFELPASCIGLITAIWPATVFISCFFCGQLLDRWGFRRSILLGLALSSLGFLGAALSLNVICFSMSLAILGLGRSFSEPSFRAALSAMTPIKNRSEVFRKRYMFMNGAAIIGPLIGAFLYPVFSYHVLFLTAGTYLIAWVLAFLGSKNLPALNRGAVNRPKFQPLSGFCLLLENKALRLWVLSAMLILAGYSGYETLIPLVVGTTAGKIPVLGYLLSLNAAVVIFMQLLPLGQRHYRKDLFLAQWGFIGLIVGFATFALFYSSFTGLIVATVLFSAGESYVFPFFDTLMDRIAPEGAKATYFAIGEMKQLGLLLGPSLGGIMFDLGGASSLFFSFSMLCSISLFSFSRCLEAVAGNTLRSRLEREPL